MVHNSIARYNSAWLSQRRQCLIHLDYRQDALEENHGSGRWLGRSLYLESGSSCSSQEECRVCERDWFL